MIEVGYETILVFNWEVSIGKIYFKIYKNAQFFKKSY